MSERAKVNPIPSERPSGVRAKLTDLAAWAATGKKEPKRSSGVTKQSYERAALATEVMMQTGDYAQAKPLNVFALFCKMHLHCYGVEMGDNTPTSRSRACVQIGGFLRNQCGGDVDLLIDFTRWAWAREIATEAWRRANPGRGGSRLQVRWLYTAARADDYRVDMARLLASARPRP